MVIIKEVKGKKILDTRKEKTILISIKTDLGVFSASAPNGKSKGKHEAKSYKKDLNGDIKVVGEISDYFSEEVIEKFEDLRRVEDIVEGHVGANTMFALESAILRALACEQKKQVWQIINPEAKKFPRFVGNVIGGGKHSDSKKKPDFQEFLLIPKSNSPKKSFEEMEKLKENVRISLKEKNKYFKEEENDENAWQTSLNEKEVLEILNDLKVDIGVDVASSGFYKRKKYYYENPKLTRTMEEQFSYLKSLIKNFGLFYIEDGFEEEGFKEFSELLKSFPESLIVGDDLTVTDEKRLNKAIEEKSINAIIVKPNQNGSLMKVKRICEIAKENNIKIVFSHRSGETSENILADLAFGFEADFFKCGIDGKGRKEKIQRLIEIEKTIK